MCGSTKSRLPFWLVVAQKAQNVGCLFGLTYDSKLTVSNFQSAIQIAIQISRRPAKSSSADKTSCNIRTIIRRTAGWRRSCRPAKKLPTGEKAADRRKSRRQAKKLPTGEKVPTGK
jgi:hypothetical protein